MKLELMTKEDLALREAIESDLRMMAELGGCNTKEQIEKSHSKALESAAAGTCLKIVVDRLTAGAGFIGVWKSFYRESPIDEMGWMVLPQFQGRGLATQAARETLRLAAEANQFQTISAFSGISNAPSNALCKRLGFEKLEECEIEYQSRKLTCNHWQIKLP